MASTVFSPGTVVKSDWLNDVNAVTYSIKGHTIYATEEFFPGITSTDPNVSTPQLKAFLLEARGRQGVLLPIDYHCNDTLKHDPLWATHILGMGINSDGQPNRGTRIVYPSTFTKNGLEIVYSYAQWAPGGGADAHVQSDIANSIPPLGNADQVSTFENIGFIGPGVTASYGTQSIQLHSPGPVVKPMGIGIFCYWVGSTVLKNIWASNWPNGGLETHWSFSMEMYGGYYVGNRNFGIVHYDSANAVKMTKVNAIGNGMVSGEYASYNCVIDSTASFPAYGVTIDECDFEGAGSPLPGYGFTKDAKTATITGNIVVASGIATAPLSGGNLIQAGHWIGVTGGTTFHSNKPLNCKGAPAIVTAATATSISWPTSASDGTYNREGIKIGPYVVGLGLNYVYATDVKMYAEGCYGAGITVGPLCQGVTIHNCTLSESPVYVDGYLEGTSIQIAANGSGYAVNDIVTLPGGKLHPKGSPVQMRITGFAGPVPILAYVQTGKYLEFPGGGAVTGGSGTGMQVNCEPRVVQPIALSIAHNQFGGSSSGITAVSPVGLDIQPNAFTQSSLEFPVLYLGKDHIQDDAVVTNYPNGIRGGISIDTGINQYVSAREPGHKTNTAVGMGVLRLLQDSFGNGVGRQNTGVGHLALKNVTAGYSNTAVGQRAGTALTLGFNNTAYGTRSLDTATNTQGATVIGFGAASGITEGLGDVMVGFAAGLVGVQGPSGGNNVFLGNTAGRQTGNSAASYCIVLGTQSTTSSWAAGITNFIAIGKDAALDPLAASNVTIIGSSATTLARIYGKPRLDTSLLSSSTTNTVTNKIRVNVNGTDYFLLASTSGT